MLKSVVEDLLRTAQREMEDKSSKADSWWKFSMEIQQHSANMENAYLQLQFDSLVHTYRCSDVTRHKIDIRIQ